MYGKREERKEKREIKFPSRNFQQNLIMEIFNIEIYEGLCELSVQYMYNTEHCFLINFKYNLRLREN